MPARRVALLLALLLAPAAAGQPPPPPVVGSRFGSPLGHTFTPDGVFGRPPNATPPPVLPSAPVDDPLLPPPPPRVWKGSFDAGLTGASGNSEVFNGRIGLNADRKTDANVFHTDFLYALGIQAGKTTQDTAILNARDEVTIAGSRFSAFGSTNLEYDQLRAYRFLVGLYAGVGMKVIDRNGTFLKTRFGAGAVRQLGAPGDRWVPELLFGYDVKHKFTDRQSFVSTLDFYPRADEFGQFRLRARAAYEVILDPELCLFVRLGVQSRYDSDSGPNIKRHDLNYFATMGLSF